MSTGGSFWCDGCRRWTAPDPEARAEGRMVCSSCGEDFSCGECGYEIDTDGACTRPIGPDTGYCPSSVNLPIVTPTPGRTDGRQP